MDRLRAFEVFVAIADAGSFTKAAVRLRMSPPSVTRVIAALEDRLGVRLLTRTTRRLTLTDAGVRFLGQARHLLQEVDAAEKEITGQVLVPHGHLTVTTSDAFGRHVLAPAVAAFQRTYPQINVSALLLDRVVNLVEEGVDVAIRIGELPDSRLVAVRVGAVRRVLVASPAYLAQHGRPSQPADLKRHSIIAFTGLLPNREWRYGTGRDASRVSLAPRLEVNDAAACIAAAERGEGITVGLSYMITDQLRRARLALVLDDFAPPPVPVHLVYPPSRQVAPVVRAFVDFFAPRLRRSLASMAL